MVCFYPVTGYRSIEKTENGKRKIVFSPNKGYMDLPVTVSCGQCLGCRLDRSKSWAIRCLHESKLYDNNCFITLTYNDENLPDNRSLDKRHVQLFFKKLRKRFNGITPIYNEKTKKNEYPIRYFYCGEYGEKYNRPHYHICLFNFVFPDVELFERRSGYNTYISNICEEIWGKGFCVIGDVNYESAGYVARYILKKAKKTGDEKLDEEFLAKKREHFRRKYYKKYEEDTKILPSGLLPEYICMSRRPGIGRNYYEEFKDDIFPADEVIIKGKSLTVPKYYSNIFETENRELYLEIKKARKEKLEKHSEDLTPERLEVREKCVKSRLKDLKRSYENDEK